MEVFDDDLVKFVACMVDSVGEIAVIWTNSEAAQRRIFLAFCQFVYVENDLLFSTFFQRLSAVDGVRFSFLGTVVIEEVTVAKGYPLVILLDAREKLLEECFLELFGIRHRVFDMRILSI